MAQKCFNYDENVPYMNIPCMKYMKLYTNAVIYIIYWALHNLFTEILKDTRFDQKISN